ncbi:MAG: oxidoreductase [Calditrichaeota bacterium]|nr:MAG: oxidoreductase [Calditrichota bacterium]
MSKEKKSAAKPKLALYWAASCGGCEIAVLDINEKILDVANFFDIVFWPVAIDAKVKDVEALEDGAITLCLFNGAIRNSENEKIAKLLRQKSVVMVAFGSCAYEGCIPALSNTTSKAATLDWVFKNSPSTVNPDNVRPQLETETKVGTLELPEFWETVRALDQVVEVDYYVPGCPPQAHQIWAVLETVVDILANGKPLPPKGTILGAGDKTCCDECSRHREEKKIKKFVRPHEIIPDPNECLLDQGILCCGPATRSGCGGLCTSVGIPCRGCYGPPPNSKDQGTKLLSALSSVIDSDDPAEIDKILDGIVDPVGTFYRFSMSKAILGRKRIKNGVVEKKGEMVEA